MAKTFTVSAEYVTLGHPDRLCDTIASNLINRIQKNDKEKSHAAVEVFASDDTVVFGGEVTTTLNIDDALLKEVLKESFRASGYYDWRRNYWTKEEVYLARDTKIVNKIHAQSPDIALGTTDKGEDSGFNDQGIFFGAYDGTTPTGQGFAKFIAQGFGDYIFKKANNEDDLGSKLGSDIKTVATVEMKENGVTPTAVKGMIVAVPHVSSLEQKDVKKIIEGLWKEYVEKTNALKKVDVSNVTFTVNGTGRYVNHGYHSDASMTGRKLAVNNMGAGPVYSQCQCGGGSYIKPFHASDLLLPMAGNWIAHAIVEKGYSKYANVALSCAIGSHKLASFEVTGDKKFNANTELKDKIVKYFTETFKWSPATFVKEFKIFETDFLWDANLMNFATSKKDVAWNDVSSLSDKF